MHRFLISILAVHWAVVFGLSAFGVAGGSAAFGHSAAEAALATGNALVATVFVWCAFAAWTHNDDGTGITVDVARLALASAVAMLAVGAVHGMIGEARQLPAWVAMQLAALGASYLVIRVEAAACEDETVEQDYSNAVARRLAVGAAHGSMLTRLSGREADTGQGDF